jgi:hypothetical protein
MRLILFLLACAALCAPLRAGPEVHVTIPAPVPDFSEARFIRCISAVENPRNLRIGRHGESGSQQMTRAARANGGPLAHLRWLEQTLHTQDMIILALAWHAGAVGSTHPTAKQRDYAARVAALYNDPSF